MNFKTHLLALVLCAAMPRVASAQNPAANGPATVEARVSNPQVQSMATPAAEASPSLLPEANLFEIGLFGGMFLPSSHHNLQNESKPHRLYDAAAPELGLRIAYFPLAFLGAELEGAAIPARVKGGGGAGIWAARGHLIGQLTSSRITPFLLLGFGALGGISQEMGSDTDGAVHVGIGIKAALDEVLSVRLDLRDTLSQKNQESSAIAHYPELLLGLSMTLDRTKPKSPPAPLPPPPPPPADGDEDGFSDVDDACPAVPGVAPKGCPLDSDRDGFADTDDACPAVPGVAPNGCPLDSDGDGLSDAQDQCPTSSGPAPTGCPPASDLDAVPTQ